MGSKDFESQRNIKMMKLKWTCNKSNLKETIRITMTVSMKIKSKWEKTELTNLKKNNKVRMIMNHKISMIEANPN
jgi:hypothetical protein